MVSTTVSKDILFMDGSINSAKEEASIERRAYTAFLSMQGICTYPSMGSQVSPNQCSIEMSAALSI